MSRKDKQAVIRAFAKQYKKTAKKGENVLPNPPKIKKKIERKRESHTRTREAIKNDQAYIEQQNYSVVRRFVGYQRLDTQEQLEILNKLYELLSNYQNFFQPVMRLQSKIRDGAKVTRKYDKALTAYQRVLKRKDIPKETEHKLRKRYKKLNPKKLLLEITNLGIKLSKG